MRLQDKSRYRYRGGFRHRQR
ncbi:MAG: hypothetical protein UZ15_CFX003003062, partial [Chloroflexi bacterium OLB15]